MHNKKKISLNRREHLKKLFESNLIIALEINNARENIFSRNKCVAIYLYKRKIMSIGINRTGGNLDGKKYIYDSYWYEFHHMVPKYNIHAELDGYMKILKNQLNFDTMLIYRGEECNLPSKPCIACAAWLKKLNNINICFINDKHKFDCCKSESLEGHMNLFHKEKISLGR